MVTTSPETTVSAIASSEIPPDHDCMPEEEAIGKTAKEFVGADVCTKVMIGGMAIWYVGAIFLTASSREGGGD